MWIHTQTDEWHNTVHLSAGIELPNGRRIKTRFMLYTSKQIQLLSLFQSFLFVCFHQLCMADECWLTDICANAFILYALESVLWWETIGCKNSCVYKTKLQDKPTNLPFKVGLWEPPFSVGVAKKWFLIENFALCSFKCFAQGYFDSYDGIPLWVSRSGKLCTWLCVGRSLCHASKSNLQ